MGVDVDAIAGIGIIVDMYKIDDEDAREALEGAMYRRYSTDALIVEQVGSSEEDRHYFIGRGGKTDWSDKVDGVPITLPDQDTIRAEIKAFLEGLPCKDGTWLTLFDEAKFGFHVYTFVS